MLTDNQENTFTLKPINCYNGKCSIELKVNGKKMTNAEMPGVGQIKISREHLQAVSMKGMIRDICWAVTTFLVNIGLWRTTINPLTSISFPSIVCESD